MDNRTVTEQSRKGFFKDNSSKLFVPHNLPPKKWLTGFNVTRQPFSAVFTVAVKVESLSFSEFMVAVKVKEPSFFSRLLVCDLIAQDDIVLLMLKKDV